MRRVIRMNRELWDYKDTDAILKVFQHMVSKTIADHVSQSEDFMERGKVNFVILLYEIDDELSQYYDPNSEMVNFVIDIREGILCESEA